VFRKGKWCFTGALILLFKELNHFVGKMYICNKKSKNVKENNKWYSTNGNWCASCRRDMEMV
jgi:hypothetical protein